MGALTVTFAVPVIKAPPAPGVEAVIVTMVSCVTAGTVSVSMTTPWALAVRTPPPDCKAPSEIEQLAAVWNALAEEERARILFGR